jgi:hypothetical protein
MACPTCILLKAALESLGVSPDVSEVVSRKVGKPVERKVKATVKRKASAYNKRYSRAFKKVSGRYKTKAGKWKKNGFAMANRAAHRLAKK